MAGEESSQKPVQTTADVPRESPRTILFQFVIFPLGVVAIGVAIFLIFGMLAAEKHSIREYVGDIRTGSSHRRWQAAYELSKSLKRGEAKDYPGLVPEISALYDGAANDDPKVRRYLGMVLGTLGDPRATPSLLRGLKDAENDDRIFTILALAELQDPSAVPSLAPLVKSDDPAIRKSAVYAIGRIGGPHAAEPLASALTDGVADVRWNAAIGLARLHDNRAVGVLRQMLDRKSISAAEGVREDQKEAAMIAAIAAATELALPDLRPSVEALAASDPSVKVRSAAKQALAAR